MNFRQKAVVAAVSLALSSLFIHTSVSANQSPAVQDATVAMASQPQPAEYKGPDVSDNPQPAQTKQEVVSSAKAQVQDAMADVDRRAGDAVRQQRKKLREKGKKDVRVMYGTALVNAKSADPDWGDRRVIAYQRAVVAAREKLLKQLYGEVTTRTLRENFRTNQLPEFTPEEIQTQKGLDAALGVVVAIADTAVGGRLEEMGIDSKAYEAATPTKRKVMMKKAFSKMTQRESRGELSGAIVTRTFETTDANGNTAVAVVLTTSNKLKNTLENFRVSKGRIAPNPKRAKISIDDFLEQNHSNLMYQHGITLMYDEEGYPVLISYAQAGNECNPVDYEECVDNREFSFIEAENDAYANFAEVYNLQGVLTAESRKGEEKIKDATLTRTESGDQTIEGTTSRLLKEVSEMSEMNSAVKDLVGIEEGQALD